MVARQQTGGVDALREIGAAVELNVTEKLLPLPDIVLHVELAHRKIRLLTFLLRRRAAQHPEIVLIQRLGHRGNLLIHVLPVAIRRIETRHTVIDRFTAFAGKNQLALGTSQRRQRHRLQAVITLQQALQPSIDAL